MIDFNEFKKHIIDTVKSRFTVKQLNLNFQNEFYYPKFIHFLKFNIEQYEVEGLGNMAILSGNGLKVMKMITVVFTPSTKKDIPFVIIDFIKMANKRTVFVEFYLNHIKGKDKIKEFEDKLKKLNNKYSNIENYIETHRWYTPLRSQYSPLKTGTKNHDNILYEMVLETIVEYLDYVSEDKDEMNDKNKQLEDFINNLIYKGNPSTTVLEKAIGKEETIRLFKDVVFYYNGG